MARDWVLIADDSEFMRMKLEQIVDSLGYEPLPAADGAAAPEAFKKNNPPIVLLDVEMPELSGVEVCRQIRELNAETFIIMVSSERHADIVEEAIEAGANDYVSKPFTADRLKAAFDRRYDAA
ncbi:MAG: response regulator [Dehalococcoidia bacterium]|nr:response regulator [Dehalococcoidia bacterium]